MATSNSYTSMGKLIDYSPATLELALNAPALYNKIVKQFGKQYRDHTLAEDLLILGAQKEIQSEFYTYFSEGRIWESITVNGAVTGGGASETITIDLPDSNRVFAKPGQSIMLPGTFQELYIESVTVDGSAHTADLVVYAGNDGDVVPAISDGAVLMIGSNAYGEASEQPKSTIKQYEKHQVQLQIIKDTVSMSGSQMVEKSLVDISEYDTPFNFYSTTVADGDARMDLYESHALVFGDGGTVIATQAMVDEGLADVVGDPIRKTKGIIPTAIEEGFVLPTDATVADIADFEDMDNYLTSLDDASDYILGRLGNKLARAYSHNIFDTIVSGNGTDVTSIANMMVANGLSDAEAKSMAAMVNYSQYTDTARTYMWKRADEFSNAKRYGISDYKLDESGVWWPAKTVREDGITMPMVTLLYKGDGTTSRRRTFWELAGAGANPASYVLTKDAKYAFMRSHIGAGIGAPKLLIFSNANA
jgi:hypothetical protein